MLRINNYLKHNIYSYSIVNLLKYSNYINNLKKINLFIKFLLI